MRNNNKKQLLLSIIGIAIILIAVGVTYAFFNYTKTGISNTVQTGRIVFNSNQTDTISLTNAFPIARNTASTDTDNTGDFVIAITGDTMYSGGIEYLVTATAVENTKNSKSVPISIVATASSGLGTADEEYFDNRGSTSAVYKVLAKNTISNNDKLLVGYIPSGAAGVNGTLKIRAFFDKDLISISDTYDATNGVSDSMGTTSEWVNGRTNFTTTEWNTISVSFKVKVEAQEGTWVDEVRTVNAMNTFPSTITDQKANIKEVYFSKMGATAMQSAYDNATIKTDLTYNNEGKVLAWFEENQDDNSKYNLIVASNGDTYLTTGSNLFNGWSNVEFIEFNNVNTIRVSDMNRMFYHCDNLVNLDLTNLGSSILTNIEYIFGNCSKLKTINMSGFNFGLVSSFGGTPIFMKNVNQLNSLEEVDLSNANMSNMSDLHQMFAYTNTLKRVNLSNVTFANNLNLFQMFLLCTSLTEIDLSSMDLTNATNTDGMFIQVPATIGYARTQADADILNNSSSKPSTLNFVVKAS